jgi:hypothetical protein
MCSMDTYSCSQKGQRDTLFMMPTCVSSWAGFSMPGTACKSYSQKCSATSSTTISHHSMQSMCNACSSRFSNVARGSQSGEPSMHLAWF